MLRAQMDFRLLSIFIFLSVVVVGATTSVIYEENYWKSVMPNSPMPKAIKQLLHPESKKDSKAPNTSKKTIVSSNVQAISPDKAAYWCYQCAPHESQVKNIPIATLFFLQNNLQQRTKMKLQLVKNTKITKDTIFLPRDVANSIPFSSKDLPKILKHFSIKADSAKGETIKQTITLCEAKAIEGEVKHCATSLESMIEFSTSELGQNIKAISTEVTNSKEVEEFRVKGVENLIVDNVIVCHKQDYVYAVFYCHKILKTKAYMVSLVGSTKGTSAQAVAVCHIDTKAWNPKHLAFQTLKVKPGTVPICHFLPEDLILWMPY